MRSLLGFWVLQHLLVFFFFGKYSVNVGLLDRTAANTDFTWAVDIESDAIKFGARWKAKLHWRDAQQTPIRRQCVTSTQ